MATSDEGLRERDAMIRLIKENLQQAQNRMKQLADSHRTERFFAEGDMVYLRFQPYRQTSITLRINQKLVS